MGKYGFSPGAIPVPELLAMEELPAMPSPFIQDAVFSTPSGKFVTVKGVQSLVYVAGKSYLVKTWEELRALYRKDPEHFEVEGIFVRYLGTRQEQNTKLFDLAVTEEYLKAEPRFTGDLPGEVRYFYDTEKAPAPVKLLAAGQLFALIEDEAGSKKSVHLSTLYALTEADLDAGNSVQGWKSWWNTRPVARNLALLMDGRPGPWDIPDQRELKFAGAGTIALLDLLAGSEALQRVLITDTPCVNPDGKRALIKNGLRLFLGSKEFLARTWREAREHYSGGARPHMISVSYGRAASYLAPELVRVPLAEVFEPQLPTRFDGIEVVREYDYASGTVKLTLLDGGATLTGAIAEGEAAALEEKLSALRRARASLVAWVEEHPAGA